jgi:hypothetical protein
MAMEEVKAAASAVDRSPFRPVACGEERAQVLSCYQEQSKAAGGKDFAARSLQCHEVVSLFEKCAEVQARAMVRPGSAVRA